MICEGWICFGGGTWGSRVSTVTAAAPTRVAPTTSAIRAMPNRGDARTTVKTATAYRPHPTTSAVTNSRPWITQIDMTIPTINTAFSIVLRPRITRSEATMNGTMRVESTTSGNRPMIAWPEGNASPSAKNGTIAVSAIDPVVSNTRNARDTGSTTNVIAITGPIASAGDGAPSHDTTALIASNPGRGRTNDVPSRGIGISGRTLCARAIAVASPAWVGASQSGGRTWPRSAQKKMAAPTPPATSAGSGSHHGASSG